MCVDFGNNFCGHCGTSRKSKCEGSGDTLNNANMSTGVKRRLDDKEIQGIVEMLICKAVCLNHIVNTIINFKTMKFS